MPSTFIKSRRPQGWRDFSFCIQTRGIQLEIRRVCIQTLRCRARTALAGAAAAGAEALDLASLGRRHVVRSPAHLPHEPLLLHLAPELAECLLELLGILDYDSHNRKGYLKAGRAPVS